MSLSLTQFENDGIEIYIDANSGESFTSISGYARLSGKSKSTIYGRLESFALNSKTAEIQTSQGLRTVRLVTEDMIAAWLPKDNPEMCTNFLRLGIRKYNYTLAGYTEPQQPEPVPQLPPVENKPLWVKQLPPMPEIYDQGAPDEVNYYGLIPGIDYPDPYVLEAWDKTYKLSSQCQQWQHLREAKWKKEDYLRQFDRDKLIAARVREVAYGKEDQSIFNGEYRKLLVMGKIRHLKEPLPLNIHHRFYTIPAVVARYKTHYPFLTTLNIWTMFIEAEQEGLGRYDLETQCFYPICCLPNVIAAQKELEQLATVENDRNNRN